MARDGWRKEDSGELYREAVFMASIAVSSSVRQRWRCIQTHALEWLQQAMLPLLVVLLLLLLLERDAMCDATMTTLV